MISKSLACILCSAFLLGCQRKPTEVITVDRTDAPTPAPAPIPSTAECAAASDCTQQGTCFGIPECTAIGKQAHPICDPKFPPPKMPSFTCACDAGLCVVAK